MTKRTLIVASILLAGWMTNTMAQNNILSNKPYVTLAFDTTKCWFSTDVNGFEVNEVRDGLHNNVEIPINHFLKSGENVIKTYIYTSPNENTIDEAAKCEIKLEVKESGQPRQTKQTISTISFTERLAKLSQQTIGSTKAGKYSSKDRFYADEKGDVDVGETTVEKNIEDGEYAGVIVTQVVTLPLNLPIWKLFDSDFVVDQTAELNDALALSLIDQLMPYYKKFHNYLKTKNIAKAMEMIEERNIELDSAFFREKGYTRKDIEQSLNDAVKNPDMELRQIDPNAAEITLAHNRKLVQLWAGTGTPLIRFLFKDVKETNLVEGYELAFRKKGNEWIITR